MGLLRATFGTRLLGSYLRLVLAVLLAGFLAAATLAVVDSLVGAFALVALIAVGSIPVPVGVASFVAR